MRVNIHIIFLANEKAKIASHYFGQRGYFYLASAVSARNWPQIVQINQHVCICCDLLTFVRNYLVLPSHILSMLLQEMVCLFIVGNISLLEDDIFSRFDHRQWELDDA